MIIDAYDESESLTDPKLFYQQSKNLVDTCLIIFSQTIYQYVLTHYLCEPIAVLSACNGERKIYQFTYKDKKIAFYLSPIGSSPCGETIVEVHYLCGAKNYIMFGSAGNLDKVKTFGKYVVPTDAYRDEGLSYHYKKASDYIEIKNAHKVAEIFTQNKIPFVLGKTWTTDAFYRETRNQVAKRKEEGCLAVEMEVAGVQAVCDYYGLELYNFLQVGDVLEDDYDPHPLKRANHDIDKFYVALQIAESI